MKNMKILILHMFFIDFGENPAAESNQPGAQQATSGPRERETQREPFAVAFGKKLFNSEVTQHKDEKNGNKKCEENQNNTEKKRPEIQAKQIRRRKAQK